LDQQRQGACVHGGQPPLGQVPHELVPCGGVHVMGQGGIWAPSTAASCSMPSVRRVSRFRASFFIVLRDIFVSLVMTVSAAAARPGASLGAACSKG
jgi:hypothetical protein